MLPDTGAGALQDCLIPGLDIRSLWIMDARSDNVSISVVGADDMAPSEALGNLIVPDPDALFALQERVVQMYRGSGVERCEVQLASRDDTEAGPVVLGVRNWVTGSRIAISFALDLGARSRNQHSDPSESSGIQATLLILNQLDVPCVPVTE